MGVHLGARGEGYGSQGEEREGGLLSPTCQFQCDRTGLCAMTVTGSAGDGPHVPAANPADPKTVLVVIRLTQLVHPCPRL